MSQKAVTQRPACVLSSTHHVEYQPCDSWQHNPQQPEFQPVCISVMMHLPTWKSTPSSNWGLGYLRIAFIVFNCHCSGGAEPAIFFFLGFTPYSQVTGMGRCSEMGLFHHPELPPALESQKASPRDAFWTRVFPATFALILTGNQELNIQC